MRTRALVSVLLFLLLMSTLANVVLASGRQQVGGQHPNVQQQSDPIDPAIEKKLAKQRTKEHYQDLKRDSVKLLEMATELKQYVDKAGEDTLSMEVIRKCDDIEKLSKNIRGKMRGY